MKSTPLSSSNNSPRPARTGERLIKRLCADERTLRKALALHTRLEKVFKQDALPNVCAYLACEILGTEDVSWEAASLACGPGEPACFELWRSVRVVLSRFEPTVSFISLSRLYNIDAPESFINVLGAVKARAIEDSAFTSPESRDSIFFSVFIWTCSILNVDNVTVPLIADDYDLEEGELSNYVRAVASRCITLSPMIIRHIEATKPANGRLVTIIQVHGELPPQLTSPVKPKSPKRERENEDILLQDAPQLKRLKPAPTSRLDGIRRTANKLSNTAVASSSTSTLTRPHASSPIKIKTETPSSPVKPGYIGANPWINHRKRASQTNIKPPPVSKSPSIPLPDLQPSTAQATQKPPAPAKSMTTTMVQQPLEPQATSPSASSSSTLINQPATAPPQVIPTSNSEVPTQTPTQSKSKSQASGAATQTTQSYLLHHIRKADWNIIAHVETFPCHDLILKLKILDLKTRIIERDRMPKGVHAGNSSMAKMLDEMIQTAREDIASYVKKEPSAEGEGPGPGCTDIELNLKVLDLETRVTAWRKLANVQSRS